ncbi:predicted protein [Ostreococcus lucimarinus CCE9901]|jgi:hypothetical protein|uniref:Coenzyme Q-binding protein COQ10 START domain-containing protein n=1 Tax=Ostreococcus lucimarinus (strain CCE9901) TaxID=436017 RepID=A4SAF9_OSTLU|nr:predicted protein [Ostreococcus lucimarinus CCE9901]ABP00697.1 predicted protein [Ostreococcus lucimarinus CCE9901]|eukprot:XP_001422380.1 predicted protein [Ostreococcus lucimarinus CCE9901]
MRVSTRFRNFGVGVRVRAGRGRASVRRARTVLPEPVREDEDEDATPRATRTSARSERAIASIEDEDLERVELAYEVTVPARRVDARRAFEVVLPLICPRDARQAEECVRRMSSIIDCAVVDDGDEETIVRQTSKWRHSALIAGKSVTTTRIRRDDETLSVTFDVDTRGCDNNSSTLRKYVGFTDVREVSDDALAIRMHGVAQIDRATSFASRMIREVMLGAMHSQMRASLVDLGRALKE